MFLTILSWIAILLLSVSYWFQIYKIHVHKEVRDISLAFNILLGIGFTILGFTAYFERSVIFLAKQILTTVPVIVIICQILYHQNDRWHDSDDPNCTNCKEEQELNWAYCPFCGKRGKS